MAKAALGPVGVRERIVSLDAVRGVALLGIFLVNIETFASVISDMFAGRPGPEAAWTDGLVHYGVRALAEGKFYPLFSMLFGMGMAMQWMRARQAGRSFAGLYWRRMAVLGVIGGLHALLLWYGDILLIYSIAGTAMLLLIGLRARTLLITALVLVTISAAMGAGFQAISAAGPPGDKTSAEALPTIEAMPLDEPGSEKGPFFRLVEGLRTGQVDPEHPLWRQTELEAFRDGPYLDAVLFRLLTYASMMIFWQVLMGGFPHVLAMFCIGAALMKWRIFDEDRRALRRRLARVGLPVGVCAGGLYAAGVAVGHGASVWSVLGVGANVIGGPMLSLGYLGLVCLLAESGRAAPLIRALAGAGRMSLTIYLLETVVTCALMQHWGLGWFGSISRADGALIVVTVYAALVVFSILWLRAFRMGPMEWLWRTATYMRVQRIGG